MNMERKSGPNGGVIIVGIPERFFGTAFLDWDLQRPL